MTACLYMRPKVLPLLLSDTIVTRETDELDNLNVPGALVHGTKIAKFKSTHVVRKIYFFGNNVAVACAGDVDKIENFLMEISEIGDELSSPACMNKIYTLLGKYEKYVEAFACYESMEAGTLIAPSFSQCKVENFFECFTNGSGYEELARIVKGDFNTYEKGRWKEIDDYDLISNFSGRICSRMIGNELLYGKGRDWGGFAEWAFFDYKKGKWCYSPPTLHCFVLAVPLPGKRFTLEQSRYLFCYRNNPALDYSQVLGIRLVEEIQLYQWTLDNILSYEMGKELDFSEWVGWQPEEVAIQIYPYGKDELGPLFILTGNFLKTDFNIQEDNVVVNFQQEIIDQWGREAARVWGLEYVSMISLTDAEMEEAFIASQSGGWDK